MAEKKLEDIRKESKRKTKKRTHRVTVDLNDVEWNVLQKIANASGPSFKEEVMRAALFLLHEYTTHTSKEHQGKVYFQDRDSDVSKEYRFIRYENLKLSED